MSTNDRRGFLRQLAGFTAASTVAAVPVAAQASNLQEDPALLALAPGLHRAEADYRHAAEQRARALAAYYAALSPVPEELVIDDWREQNVVKTSLERDYDGKLVGESGRWRNVAEVWGLEGLVARTDGRTRVGRLARKRLHIATAYQAQKDALEVSTGLKQADHALQKVSWTLREAVTPIMQAEARTMGGIALKARAMIALAALDHTPGFYPGNRWGREFAENVIAVEGAHV